MPQLERQITALLFERLTKHRNPDEVRALARDGQHVATPADVIKDPFVLEFLDVREHPAMLERDIEQAIIDRLEIFLLEMGKGFCFVGRQVRMTIDGDHFYVDLVFYNRLLRCFVLVDRAVRPLPAPVRRRLPAGRRGPALRPGRAEPAIAGPSKTSPDKHPRRSTCKDIIDRDLVATGWRSRTSVDLTCVRMLPHGTR